MTIDEKIAHWRDVMRMAKDRGIDVYWFTWNTFLFGAEGKHGLKREGMGEEEIRYFRASVRETVKTYPLLAGLGITAGEHMGEEPAGRTKEQWLWQAYGEGIRDALATEPGRPFRLIHRFHMTDLDEIRSEFRDLSATLDFSYKYAVAHMYASTRPRFIEPLLKVLPGAVRTWLTVRNDDVYSFRWGDPAFAREFVKQLPGPSAVRGFYMGPDGYCWGREAMDKEPESPRQLVMQKQWFSFILWGRLSFDPTLPDAHFERVLAARFPLPPARSLSTTRAAKRSTRRRRCATWKRRSRTGSSTRRATLASTGSRCSTTGWAGWTSRSSPSGLPATCGSRASGRRALSPRLTRGPARGASSANEAPRPYGAVRTSSASPGNWRNAASVVASRWPPARAKAAR